MKSGQRRAGFALALGLLTLGLAAGLSAEGLYVLGGIGAKSIYDTGVSDYYGTPDWNTPDTGVLDGAVSVGWRFPHFIAVEGSVTGDGSQSYFNGDADGYGSSSTLNINAMPTFAIGPVFYWEHPSWWFGETESFEIGLKLEYATLSGSDTFSPSFTSPNTAGSLNFSGQTFGFGVFVRDLEIWAPGGFSIGAEAGWDSDYFNTLSVTSSNGQLSESGNLTSPYTNNGVSFDNSGGYIRLVLGWSQHARVYAPAYPVYRRRPRRYYYYDDGYGAPNDGQPGDTIPSQPEPQAEPQGQPQGGSSAQPGDTIPSQPDSQAEPQAQPTPDPNQSYPADRNTGD